MIESKKEALLKARTVTRITESQTSMQAAVFHDVDETGQADYYNQEAVVGGDHRGQKENRKPADQAILDQTLEECPGVV
jgi:hypothetical protein